MYQKKIKNFVKNDVTLEYSLGTMGTQANKTYTNMKYCNTKYIKNQTKKMSYEKLNFKGGIALADVDIFIDGGKTRSKVRRIIEKRVSQDYWKQSTRKYPDNHSRYRTRHHVSNHLKNIFGEVPCGFQMAC